MSLLVGPVLVLVAGLPAVATEPNAPYVVFTRGTQPQPCGSAPTLGSLTVPAGTAFVVGNSTGLDATLFVDGLSVLPVPHGSGAELELTVGQHDVRIVPDCLAYTDAVPLAVTVSGTPPDEPSPPASPPATTTAPAPPTTTPPGAVAGSPTRTTSGPGSGTGPSRSASASPSPGPAAGTSSGDSPATRSPAPVAAAVVTNQPGVIAARPVDLPDQGHPKGVRLLAVLATICVLGVTAAIIRSIVRLSP